MLAFQLTLVLLGLAQCVNPPAGTMVAWYPFDEFSGGLSANLATEKTGVGSLSPPTLTRGGKIPSDLVRRMESDSLCNARCAAKG